VAIQFRAIRNWAKPNAQPIASARRSECARNSNSHRPANATGSSGHQSTGWKAKAEMAPTRAAVGTSGKCFIGFRLCGEQSDEAIQFALLDCFAPLAMTKR